MLENVCKTNCINGRINNTAVENQKVIFDLKDRDEAKSQCLK